MRWLAWPLTECRRWQGTWINRPEVVCGHATTTTTLGFMYTSLQGQSHHTVPLAFKCYGDGGYMISSCFSLFSLISWRSALWEQIESDQMQSYTTGELLDIPIKQADTTHEQTTKYTKKSEGSESSQSYDLGVCQLDHLQIVVRGILKSGYWMSLYSACSCTNSPNSALILCFSDMPMCRGFWVKSIHWNDMRCTFWEHFYKILICI